MHVCVCALHWRKMLKQNACKGSKLPSASAIGDIDARQQQCRCYFSWSAAPKQVLVPYLALLPHLLLRTWTSKRSSFTLRTVPFTVYAPCSFTATGATATATDCFWADTRTALRTESRVLQHAGTRICFIVAAMMSVFCQSALSSAK